LTIRNMASLAPFEEEGEYYDPEDGYDEMSDDDDEIEMNPDHPAMQRVQLALKRQLMARKEKAEADLRIKRAQLKDAKRRREDVGVSLYSAQQVLAKAQLKLETMQDNRGDLEITRRQTDEELAKAKELFSRMLERHNEVKAQTDQAQARADKLRLDAKSTKTKGDEMESRLKQGKRQADKASVEEQEAEVQKQRQDLYVDRLGEAVKEVENEIKVTTTHREAQAEATQQALGRLNEAQSELDQLAVERREITQQWKKALFGLQQRSEARAKIQAACAAQQQEVFAQNNEIENLGKMKMEENDNAEIIELRKRRLEADQAGLKRTIANTKRTAADVQQEYSVITRTLQEGEKCLARAQQTANILASENNALRQRLEKAALKKTTLLDAELGVKYNQETLSKAGKALLKEIGGTRHRIADIEMRMHQTDNKSAREKMKIMAFESAVESSTKQLNGLKEALRCKEQQLDEFEVDARRDGVEINRKEAAIQALQQQLDTILSQRAALGAGRADVTPQELERDELRDEINCVIGENVQTQQRWLQKQSEFVELTKEIEQQTSELDDLQIRNAVLQQKKFRVIQEIEQNQKELRKCQHAFKNMQHEVVKLNTLISKNSGFKDDLESNNELMETEFLRRLKDEELESIQVQTRVEELIDERARIEQDVVDAEREILEWEKRIQLAQEMKESLMGDEDSNELAAMKKEIHRMRLRLDQLSRQREVLITSMERSVDRRGDIHTKSQAASKTKGSANHNMVKREIIDLQKRIKRSCKDADHAEANVDSCCEEIETLRSYVEQERAEVQHFEDELQDLSVERDVKSRERTQNRDRIMEDQYLYKHLSAAKEKKKTYKKSAEQYDTDIAGHYNTLKDLNNVAAYVAEEQPVAAQALGAVQASIEHKLESQPRSKA